MRYMRSSYARQGFTLIELLIVVVIIAILIAILISSLARAREQARIVKCMANQRTIGQAVQGFATEHQGYGQLIAISDDWKMVGLHRDRYVYEDWPWPVASIFGGQAKTVASPWPIAYADHLGVPGVKSKELFDPSAEVLLTGVRVEGGRRGVSQGKRVRVHKKSIPVLQCPSDRDLVGLLPGAGFARISYSINRDIFSHGWGRPFDTDYRQRYRHIWRQGNPHGGYALEGRLEGVVRPSEVIMFADGGGRADSSVGYAYLEFYSGGWGPRWSDFAGSHGGAGHVPFRRHRATGGVVGVHVDVHASYLRAVQWGPATTDYILDQYISRLSEIVVPTRYSPNPRITPYEP